MFHVEQIYEKEKRIVPRGTTLFYSTTTHQL